ncbi:MAG: ATP-dependent zinc metalloprotease FtsH [Candidatus Kapabacteria bacterium]|nr:ATP-dependent zinc metalloprotease FtsH [Candidatus Kapabacteria bacterium]
MNNNNNNDDDDSQVGKVIRSVLIWVGIFAGVILLYMFYTGANRDGSPITYTEYIRLLDQNYIEKAVITKSGLNDYEFRGQLKQKVTVQGADGRPHEIQSFTTKLGTIDARTEELWASKGITWTYEQTDNSWMGTILTILMWVALFAVFIIMMRRMQGGGAGGRNIFSFGKVRTRMNNENTKRVTFIDVAGAEEAKYELQEIVDFLREPLKYQRLGGKIPRGVLLLGPPGTGKTLLAKAVSGEANVPFFSISGADFVEMFVGVGASRVRDLFEQAKRNAPCIVFIDEIDAVGRHRGAGLGGGHDEREQTLNALLVEMDGFEANNGVIVIAATNRADVLDPALLRPGRFDRHVVVDRPDIKGREGILKVHTRNIPLGNDVDLNVIARGTPGASGADLANIVNEAALFAARRNSSIVTMYDFESAKDKVIMGIERKSMVLSDNEKKTTAYHEMGHALAGTLLPHSDPVHKVTIIPRGPALGVTAYLPKEDAHTMSKEYIETRIMCLMAGRAAEKIVFNQFTTGASNDLERATALARNMITKWGMNDTIGPVSYGQADHEVFLGRDYAQQREYSELTAQKIDAEVAHVLHSLSDQTEKLLRDNLDMLHTLSEKLLERETLDGEELAKLMRGETLPPVAEKTKQGVLTFDADVANAMNGLRKEAGQQ